MNEDLFLLFDKMPGALALYQAIEQRIDEAFPDVRRKVGKTQVSFSCRYGFAYVSLPTRKVKGRPEVYVILTFGLAYQEKDPRIAYSVEPYPGRWTHHVIISSVDEIDSQVMGWLREAYNFSMSK